MKHKVDSEARVM